jgi:hypothetical protein
MRRRTVDLIASIGAVLLAALLVILGFVMLGNARFAEDYTLTELGREKIFFPPAENLTEAEIAYTEARTGCLIANTGQQVLTGAQAECFANEYILGHLQDPERTNEGMTFAEWGAVQAPLRAQIAEAREANDPALADLQAEFDATEVARSSVFRGTMLRQGLLTSYAFSVMGEQAGRAAWAAFAGAAVLLLVAMAGFAHAAKTPKSAPFAPVETIPEARPRERELVGV